MHKRTLIRSAGLAAVLAATLAPAAAAADVPIAADRAGVVRVPSDDQLGRVPVAADAVDRRTGPAVPVQADAADRVPAPPVAADAPDRVPGAVPLAADAPDRVRAPVPVAADAPDRRVPAAPVAADDGLPVAAPVALAGLLAAAGAAGLLLLRARRARPASLGTQRH